MSQNAKAPRVSALMPVYNSNLKYLKEAIDSVLAQTFADFELLILNDSPENAELDKFIVDYAKKDVRIKYHKNSRNLGISPSRNKLMDLAKGEFIAPIDHDDVNVKERFAKEVEFLDANDDVGVVSVLFMIDEKEGEVGKGYVPFSKGLFKDDEIKINLMINCPLSHPGAMIRAEVLRQNGVRYNALYTPSEDYKLWCDLLPHTNFAVLPEVLHYHRGYENTTQRELSKQRERHWAIVAQNKHNFPELFDIAIITSSGDVLPNKKRYSEKRVKILGLSVLKIVETPSVLKYKLFGRITILKILKS